jgi:hypothetical protein
MLPDGTRGQSACAGETVKIRKVKTIKNIKGTALSPVKKNQRKRPPGFPWRPGVENRQ